MEPKEVLGLKLISNFGTFAEFHSIAGQKLDKIKTEDEKLKMLAMIKFIYKNVLDEVLYSAVNESLFNPCLGHFISTLINIAINDKYFKIKNEVIENNRFNNNRLNGYYKITRKGHNPSDLLASFLPGISQFLMKVITKDEKQNKIVYINSLKTLSSLFVGVYRNYDDGLTDKLENYPFIMPRTKEWQLKSIEKLNIIIQLIERSLINQSVDVKEALVNFSAIILFHIVDYKENHHFLFLISRNLFKIPLTLIYDENESVRQLSLSITQKVATKFSFENSKVFILEEQLMDDLFKLIDNFEKELSVYSEETIFNNLKLLCGYLNCFKQNNLNLILSSQKDKLFNLLKLIYKLDFNRMSLNVLPKEQTEFTNIDFFDKKFFYFENKELLNQLDVLFNLIKKLIDQNVFNDYLMESLINLSIRDNYRNLNLINKRVTNSEFTPDDSTSRSTNLLIISHLVKAFDSSPFNLQMIKKLVNLLEIELNQIDNDELYIDERFELTVFCALLIEVITNFAYSISREEQRQYFISTLYTLMSCTGSTHLQIQINSKASLAKLTKIFNYESVRDLILNNIDYVISKIHIKLNNFNDKENLYFVLKIIFEFTDAEICNYLDQTINNLLIAMDINYSIANFERLAKILHLVVKTFKKWFVKKEDSKNFKNEECNANFNISNNENKLIEFKTDLIEFLKKKEQDKEQLKQFEQELMGGDEKVDEDKILKKQRELEDQQIDNEETEDKSLPIHIDFTKRILEKCSNFLSYNLIPVRLMVLDIIIDGLDVLRLHEDSLLPTAHIVWESLIHRFKDETIVLFKCSECLIKLAVNCGDFIRSRTIKQVLPQIYSFLKLNWKRSLLNSKELTSLSIDQKKDIRSNFNSLISSNSNNLATSQSNQSIKSSSNAFFYSLDYRLQKLLLENLGKLAFNIKLARKDLWPLVSILTLYLTEKQPIELKTAAHLSLCELENLDYYAVYFFKNYYFHV